MVNKNNENGQFSNNEDNNFACETIIRVLEAKSAS